MQRTARLRAPRSPRRPVGFTGVGGFLVAKVLERVRTACDGPLVLMKGPEVAARYPDPALRGFRDVDLLAPDAPTVQRQLVAAGFEPVGVPEKYAAIHHLRPLAYPGLPLLVEVHDRPKWPARLRLPDKAELLGTAVPATIRYVSTKPEFTPPVIFSRETRQKLVFLVEAAIEPGQAASLHPGQPVDVRLPPLPPDRDRDTTVFRILQESLTNVARHARAGSVDIRCGVASGALVLEVIDDGIGISEGAAGGPRSLGVLGMRERARAIGAEVEILPTLPRGTAVRFRVPMELDGEPA